jgi:hypothetical protein
VLVLIQWAGAYLTYQRSVRLITGREAAYVRPVHSPPPAPTQAGQLEADAARQRAQELAGSSTSPTAS